MRMDETQLCDYIEKWYAARVDDWSIIYHGIHQSKHNGIYQIPHGGDMVNILNDVYDNFEEHLSYKNLLPACFSSPHQLMLFLKNYNSMCKTHLDWMLELPKQELEFWGVADIVKMLDDVVEMTSYCLDSFEVTTIDDTYNKSYVRMKECLLHEDIKSFIAEINLILNEIPYSIYRNKEYEERYHSIIHTILFILGFRVISEKASSLGRLDMLVELEKYIYIFEFKYSEKGEKLSNKAIQQIEEKQYALSYVRSSRKVIAVGVTIGEDHKNAFEWDTKCLS